MVIKSAHASKKKPVILVVDNETDELLLSELKRRYKSDYTILYASQPQQASSLIARLHRNQQKISLLIADRSVPNCERLFAESRDLHANSKCLLMIRFGEWGIEEVAEQIRRAMAIGLIDYYVLRPWTSPDELFHRTISELLHEFARADTEIAREITVVGAVGSRAAYRLRNQLARNGIPHAFRSFESPDGRRLLSKIKLTDKSKPVVILRDGRTLINPSEAELAQAYGVKIEVPDTSGIFDTVIIGAGPAGLSAAVYAASEGLNVLVAERESIGGQASSSSKIRNYLGFPRGLTGAELAQRAYQQAWVFNASFVLTRSVEKLVALKNGFKLKMSDGHVVQAKSVILAMGIEYRRLAIPEMEQYEGIGVFHGASPAEAAHLEGRLAFVVGAGNSAGQAALHLSRYAKQVSLLVRGDSISKTMSSYLINEINARPNIDIRLQTQIVGGSGEGRLQTISTKNAEGQISLELADAVFVLIGAIPHTTWLPKAIQRDKYGFVLTDIQNLKRPPLLFESTLPGIFAIGDTRAGSIKRVASAVGEGSVVISQIHQYLAMMKMDITLK